MTPDLLTQDPAGSCFFVVKHRNAESPGRDTYRINSLPATIPDDAGKSTGKIATMVNSVWRVDDGEFWQSDHFLSIHCTEQLSQYLAYPIDPAMTEADIEGATKIYANVSNDGWLFAHAGKGEHHDHELQLRAVVHTEFAQQLDNAMVKYLQATTSTRSDKLSLYMNLCGFRDDCLAEAETHARTKHLGERHKVTHPEVGHLATEALAVINALKAKWASDKSTEWASIRSIVNNIIRDMVAPTVETRWDMQARIDAAKKKKAEPPAETPEGDGSSS